MISKGLFIDDIVFNGVIPMCVTQAIDYYAATGKPVPIEITFH
jgi:hypothetical protein